LLRPLCFFLLLSALAGSVSAQTAAPAAVPEVRFTVSRFTVDGDNPLSQERTSALLRQYTGEYAGLDGLLAAADELERTLSEQGHSFHRVSLPPQALEGGTVVLKIVRFHLGKVSVVGNEHFDAASIVSSLSPLVPGEAPDTAAIGQAVAVANRHPAKNLTVTMRQGEQADTVDAEVKVVERRPWTLFGLLNNVGSPQTGRSRMSIGGQYSNLFAMDHVVTATATRSPQNFSGVRQYGLSYELPLYALSGWVTLSWVRSDVDTGLVEQFFDVSGSGVFRGVKFRQDLAPRGAWRHAWTVAVDDRDFDNNVSFLGAPIGTRVRSRPLSLRWDSRYLRKEGNLRGHIEYAHNLRGGSHNDEAAYNSARTQASRNWNALRFGANADQIMTGNWLARARIAGQYAGETLIPGEQFGLGGANSVRGFEERAVAADNGLSASVELWTPPISALAGLRMLGFVDAGYKDLKDPAVGEEARDTLLSVGVGARLQWRENLNVSMDWGRVIDQAEGSSSDAGNSRWHLNVLYRY
jgi:hemolysin activation/secretion protein